MTAVAKKLRTDADIIRDLRATLLAIAALIEAEGFTERSPVEDLEVLPGLVKEFIADLNTEIEIVEAAADNAAAARTEAQASAREFELDIDGRVDFGALEEARHRWQRRDRKEALHHLERALGRDFMGLEEVMQ